MIGVYTLWLHLGTGHVVICFTVDLRMVRKSCLIRHTLPRRSVPERPKFLCVQENTEMSCVLTPLFLTQEVLQYRQHVTHTNPIMYEDNPLSWRKQHGRLFPTLSRFLFGNPHYFSSCGTFVLSRRSSVLSEIFVYYESIKRESKIRCIYWCRCDERLQTKTKEFTLLAYTGFSVGGQVDDTRRTSL